MRKKTTTKASSKTAKKTSTTSANVAKTLEKTSAKAAVTTKKTATASGGGEAAGVLGLPLTTWVGRAQKGKTSDLRSGRRGFAFFLPHKEVKLTKSLVNPYLAKWQSELLTQSEAETHHFQGPQGPVWIFRSPTGVMGHATSLEKGSFAKFRDLAGSLVNQLTPFSLDKLNLFFYDIPLEEQKAVFVGLEMAAYSYSENRPDVPKARKKLPNLLWSSVGKKATKSTLTAVDLSEQDLRASARLALSVNIARHYVNLPPCDLNPRTFAESIQRLFRGSKSSQVEVWQGERLERERMNLLLAVGAAASEGPRFVHIRYRPSEGKNRKPIAIVGKGITFDSGGLDIKPSSAMRLMKKDMGGAAAAIAIAKWADMTDLAMPLDIYVSLAENAIGANAFRPGDIITARNGLTIEIHNTDAEGRLVLADALDVAVNQTGNDAPSAVINMATLTGAIKVGLGAEIAGLFSNNDELAQDLFTSGLAKGDLSWRVPLFQAYKPLFRSGFADHANASDGFGGAITAALFLELFVKGKPWAHLDVYAWKDSASGAWSEGGGNGQPVQAITEFLTRSAQREGPA
jgi:leucyl aminopeptidase